MFHFTCFNVEDPDDPTVGLVNGELAIPGNLLRREVFDPVVKQVCFDFWLVYPNVFFLGRHAFEVLYFILAYVLSPSPRECN